MFVPVAESNAQQERGWELYLDYLSETEEFESVSWDTSFEMLCDLEENPININTATREELEQLPFLSAKDVEDISEYIYKYGAMKTLGELVMIKDLSYAKRRLLFFFTYAGEVKKPGFPKLDNIMKYGKHDFIGTLKIPFYTRKGDEKGYEGYQYKHSVRYDFTYGDYVRVGFLGSQDAGEPFFAGRNNLGYDFYSFYFVLKKLGRIKTLALGRYRLRFGMGLVINNNFSFGKQSVLSSLGRGSSNIRAHSSLSEGNYLQGAAATVNLSKGLDVSMFVSYRKIDATLNKESNTIATILDNGYHRTELELSKKNNSSHTLIGGNIDYRRGGFYVGATAVYTSLDKGLEPKKDAVYRRHYAEGKDFYNIGVNYGYTGHRISFSGETATGGCKALATLNTLSYSLTEKIDLLFLQRFYSYKYYSLFAESFSEGGAVQNESGAYIGVVWRPAARLSVMAYTDFAYFAWPKYQASGTSHAFEQLVNVTYNPGDWVFNARYRMKIREKDNKDKSDLINDIGHCARVSAARSTVSWNFKTQFDLAYSSYKKNSFGWMISQKLGCTKIRHVRLNATFGYFKTDDYDSRVYSYELGMRHSYAFPSFYGNGIRYTLFANTDFVKNVELTAKIGTTKYFDRSSIGSGYQQIGRSSATDFEMQCRWKF